MSCAHVLVMTLTLHAEDVPLQSYSVMPSAVILVMIKEWLYDAFRTFTLILDPTVSPDKKFLIFVCPAESLVIEEGQSETALVLDTSDPVYCLKT